MPSRWSALALTVAVSVTRGVAAPAAAQQPVPVVAPAPSTGELVPFWLVIPDYPLIAKSARVQGVVIVAVTVGIDGRVQTATIERDIPLLSRNAVAAARDSGFLCRGCTGPVAYRMTFDFRLVDGIEAIEAARAVVTPTAATVAIAVQSPPIDTSIQHHVAARLHLTSDAGR